MFCPLFSTHDNHNNSSINSQVVKTSKCIRIITLSVFSGSIPKSLWVCYCMATIRITIAKGYAQHISNYRLTVTLRHFTNQFPFLSSIMHPNLKHLKRWGSEIVENKVNIQKSARDSNLKKVGKKISFTIISLLNPIYLHTLY